MIQGELVQTEAHDTGLLRFAAITRFLCGFAERPRACSRYVLLLLGCVLCVAAKPPPASADQFLGLVQVTCAPEAGYFSIRRFVVVAPPLEPGRNYQSLLSTLASKREIHTARELKATAAECELPVGTGLPNEPDRRPPLRIRVQGFYDDQNGQAAGARQIVENVEISAGVKPLGRLYLNTFGYRPDEIDLMEVRYDGAQFWVERCSYHRSVDPQAAKGCKREPL
jgi:hypothetical protein